MALKVLRRACGFSLFELLLVLALLAMVAGLAAPGFVRLSRSAGLSSAANQLLWGLHLARSSAVMRAETAVWCLTPGDTAVCVDGDSGARGWMVFLDRDGSSPVEFRPGDELLRQVLLPEGIRVRTTRPAITFWPTARAASTGTLRVCASGAEIPGRSVIVSQTGRPRVHEEAASCAE